MSGTQTAGIDQYFSFGNSVASAIQYGNKMYYNASANTATTTMVGGIIRLEDDTTFGNTIRGFEVQTDRGNNTQGENTALSGFARTFGVRGYSSGDAGGTFEPAGGYFETGGTSQGNAIRGYSSTITTSDLLSLYQDTSEFLGTGLLMNFGNGGGSFPATSTNAKFVDFQNAGTSKFTVSAHGTTTIGDGTTNFQAGLQIGYGGICVDDDGSCVATATGRILADAFDPTNSDLAEIYFSSQILEPGELVETDNFISVRRASRDSGERILGVVSTNPGIVMGSDDTSLIAGQRSYPLALSGRVPVKLSDENGPVAVGDPLTLSSVPGIAMKATEADEIIGYALEGFTGTRAYTDGFINQFGDSVVKTEGVVQNVNTDALLKGDCYFGGGAATGATTTKECDPVTLDELAAQEEAAAAEAQARADAEQAALDALANEPAETRYVGDNAVRVGSITMFVDRGIHLAGTHLDVLNELVSTSTELVLGAEEGSGETLWSRLKLLAQNFVDGVLAVTGIKTERVETSELCVDDVCVTADDLRALLNGTHTPSSTPTENPAPAPVPDTSGGEPTEPTEPAPNTGGTETPPTETATSTEPAATSSEPVEEPVTEESAEPVATATEPVVEPQPNEPEDEAVPTDEAVVETTELASESESVPTEPTETTEETVETEAETAVEEPAVTESTLVPEINPTDTE